MYDINIVTKDLFFQYIGYKFVKEEKKDKRIIIKEKIIDEVNKNFNKSLSYSQNDEFYDLVIKRFLSVLLPPFEFIQTGVKVKVSEEIFRAKGKVITAKGWKMVYDKIDDLEELILSFDFC
jgi:DNA topoisomerase IA